MPAVMITNVSPMPSKKVLVVDDEKTIADTLAKILNQSGFSAQAVYDGTSALQQIGVAQLC